jgi:hypothetical protein
MKIRTNGAVSRNVRRSIINDAGMPIPMLKAAQRLPFSYIDSLDRIARVRRAGEAADGDHFREDRRGPERPPIDHAMIKVRRPVTELASIPAARV